VLALERVDVRMGEKARGEEAWLTHFTSSRLVAGMAAGRRQYCCGVVALSRAPVSRALLCGTGGGGVCGAVLELWLWLWLSFCKGACGRQRGRGEKDASDGGGRGRRQGRETVRAGKGRKGVGACLLV
jgi:hypothetical protein